MRSVECEKLIGMQLSTRETKLCAKIGFDARVGEILKSAVGGDLEVLTVADWGKEDSQQWAEDTVEGEGLSIVAPSDVPDEMALEIRKLLPTGYLAWSSDKHTVNGSTAPEIAVLKTDDPFAIVRAKGTGGVNYEVYNAQILERLHQWDSLFGIDIVGAGPDWVSLQCARLPDDICAFTAEIYLFCPDSVEQGVGLMGEVENPQFFTEARALCPQISTQLEEELAARFEEDEEVVDEIKTGIQLLANSIKTTRTLFLWWD